MGADPLRCAPRRKVLAGLCVVAILLMGVPAILYGANFFDGEEFPKKSPFAAVRWQQDEPEVNVDGEWFKIVSLNGLPTADILAFSRKTYGVRWQKRFEEDLVEVLT